MRTNTFKAVVLLCGFLFPSLALSQSKWLSEDGEIYFLESVDALRKIFVWEAGNQTKGPLVFDGYRVGDRYEGFWKTRSELCSEIIETEIRGLVLADQSMIVLDRPSFKIIDDCRVSRIERDDPLILRLSQ